MKIIDFTEIKKRLESQGGMCSWGISGDALVFRIPLKDGSFLTLIPDKYRIYDDIEPDIDRNDPNDPGAA